MQTKYMELRKNQTSVNYSAALKYTDEFNINNKLHASTHNRARKIAQTFVTTENNAPEALVSERIRFLDFLVQTTVDKHSNNAEIIKLAQDYNNAPQTSVAKVQAFAKFEQASQPVIEQQQVFDASIGISHTTASICSQIAQVTQNKNLACFATGLGAMTQATNGMHQINQAASMMSQATTNAAIMTSGAMMFGAVGAVVAASCMIYSLCCAEDNDDLGNGLGEALYAIHSTVMQMWEDTRINFQTTWKLLSEVKQELHQHLNEMERRNMQRFIVQMQAISYFGNTSLQELAQLNANFQGNMNHIVDKLTSYLDAITDEPANLAVDHIRHQDDSEIINRIEDYSISLCNWLNRKATIKSHAGRIDLLEGVLDIGKQALLEELTNLLKLQLSGTKALPLGLLASLVKQLDPSLPDDVLTQMINTRDWDVMYRIYIAIMYKSLPTIASFSAAKQEAYLDNLNAVKQKPIAILEFFHHMQHSSTLWHGLFSDYIQEFRSVQAQIAQFLEAKRQYLNEEYNIEPNTVMLLLQQSFEQNCERIQADTALYDKLKETGSAKEILKRLGLRDSDVLELLQTSTLDAAHNLMMTPESMIANNLNLLTFTALVTNQHWRTRYHFGHGIYTLDREEWVYPLREWTHSVTSIDLTIRQFNVNYPFYAAKLRKQGTDFNGKAHRGDMLRLGGGSVYVINGSTFTAHHDYQAEQIASLKQFIEQKILVPRRKLAAKELKQQLDLTAFNIARLKLLCFYKLFFPQHVIVLDAVSKHILQQLTQLEQQGDATILQALLDDGLGACLLKKDIGSNYSRSWYTLQLHIKAEIEKKSLNEYPLWCTMANAYATAARLEQALETEKQHYLLNQAAENEQSLDESLHAAMPLLSAHQQALREALFLLTTFMSDTSRLLDVVIPPSLTQLLNKAIINFNEIVARIQTFDPNYLLHDTDLTIKQLVSLPSLSEEKYFVEQRWETLSETFDFSLPCTIDLLKQALSAFQLQAVSDKPAVIMMGSTGRGKSTLSNALLGVIYEQDDDDDLVLAEGSPQEYTQRGTGSQSQTLFPIVCTHETVPFSIIDMPGIGETRGTETRIANDVCAQYLQQKLRAIQSIVMVCDEDDVKKKSKFVMLRETLKAAGLLIEHHPDTIAQQLCLVVTRLSNHPEKILNVLKNWYKEEFSDPSKPCDTYIQRVLSFLIQTPGAIRCVDVANTHDVQASLTMITAMPVHTDIDNYFFVSKTMEMRLAHLVIDAILSVKRELEQEIKVLQSTVKTQIKYQLLQCKIQVPKALDDCKQTMLQQTQIEESLETVIDVIVQCIEQQQHLSHDLQYVIDSVYVALGLDKSVQVIEHGEAVLQMLMQQQADLEKHRVFFNEIESIQAIFQPRLRAGHSNSDTASVLQKYSIFPVTKETLVVNEKFSTGNTPILLEPFS